MRRTELIPLTSAAINSGKVFYHFSISRQEINAPSDNREHQICFFESQFTEMKYGGESETSDALLQWYANSENQWNVTWEAGVWHNIAYGIVSPVSCPPRSSWHPSVVHNALLGDVSFDIEGEIGRRETT